MNPWGVYAVTLLRGALAAACAVAIAHGAAVILARPLRRAVRRLAWGLLLGPWLTPALVVGYAWSGVALALVDRPALRGLLYVFLLGARLVAVAVVLLRFAPPSPVGASALCCAALVRPRRRAVRLAMAMRWRGDGVRYATAFATVFVLAVQEFEIASLLHVRSWTVWLFGAQSGGVPLARSLAWAAVPLLAQLLVLAPVLALLCRRRRLPTVPQPRRPAPGLTGVVVAWACLVVGAGAGCALPLGLVLGQAMPVVATLAGAFPLAREIAASLLVAGAAASIAFVSSGQLVGAGHGRPRPAGPARLALLVGLCLPGLLGSLLLSLLVHAAFQAPPLLAWRDGPLALILALVLLLLPPALLLRGLMLGLADGPAIHLACSLRASPSGPVRRRGRALCWHLKGRAGFLLSFLLFVWAYFDLCAGVLLRPAAMTMAPDLLYNQMHYGQRAMLSAMVCAFLGVPPVLLLASGVGRAVYHRVVIDG